jgi:hypothetical protein
MCIYESLPICVYMKAYQYAYARDVYMRAWCCRDLHVGSQRYSRLWIQKGTAEKIALKRADCTTYVCMYAFWMWIRKSSAREFALKGSDIAMYVCSVYACKKAAQ